VSNLTPRLRLALERWRVKDEAAQALLGGAFNLVRKQRYMERKPLRFERFGDGLAAISTYHVVLKLHVGLRFVGRVKINRRGIEFINNSAQLSGYILDLDGCYGKDGDGLVWGVVYQLPTKNHHERYVAGYEVGGNDEVILDLSRVFVEQSPNISSWKENHPDEIEACCDAARYADSMAEKLADDDRQYQWEQREKEKQDEYLTAGY
jgi:hypothetical protein